MHTSLWIDELTHHCCPCGAPASWPRISVPDTDSQFAKFEIHSCVWQEENCEWMYESLMTRLSLWIFRAAAWHGLEY